MKEAVTEAPKVDEKQAPTLESAQAENERLSAQIKEMTTQRSERSTKFQAIEKELNDLKQISQDPKPDGSGEDLKKLQLQLNEQKLEINQLTQYKQSNDTKLKSKLDVYLEKMPEQSKALLPASFIESVGIEATLDHIEKNKKMFFGGGKSGSVEDFIVPSFNPAAPKVEAISLTGEELGLIEGVMTPDAALMLKKRNPDYFKKFQK